MRSLYIATVSFNAVCCIVQSACAVVFALQGELGWLFFALGMAAYCAAIAIINWKRI